MTEQPPISVLEQRRIEAGVIRPLVEAFERELGPERTRGIVAGVITQLARDQGRRMAQQAGRNDLRTFAGLLEPWTRGGAIETEETERSEERFAFTVTRCRYAELYRELGLAELGYTLSCNRDGSLMQGFSPDVELRRTQTIMEGAPCCDFEYVRRKP